MNSNMYNLLIGNRDSRNILDFLPEPDLILIADEDGYEFAVHKWIMFSGSTYFKPIHYTMDRILVVNMPSEILDLIITSIYGGTVHFTDFYLAKKILNIAYIWDLKLLIEAASDYVSKNMTPERCYMIYREDNKHQPGVLLCANKYVRERIREKLKSL